MTIFGKLGLSLRGFQRVPFRNRFATHRQQVLKTEILLEGSCQHDFGTVSVLHGVSRGWQCSDAQGQALKDAQSLPTDCFFQKHGLSIKLDKYGVLYNSRCIEVGFHTIGSLRSDDLNVCAKGETVQAKNKNQGPDKLKKPLKGEKGRSSQKKKVNWDWNVSPKAVNLVEKVLVLPDVKEEVYKELDKWVAFERTFPIAYIKQALQVFQQKKKWNQVIQVSKWMLSKGQGKTLGTYEVLLHALDMQGRTDEAELLWKNNILNSRWSVPTRMFSLVMAMHERHNKPSDIIKLFTNMEECGRKLDEESVRRVARAYQRLGFLEKEKQILRKYNLFKIENSESAQPRDMLEEEANMTRAAADTWDVAVTQRHQHQM